MSSLKNRLPDTIGQPAIRALTAAGIFSAEEAAKYTDKELAALHGVGPKAIRILREQNDLNYINVFEEMLTGGHPNSLGSTVQVVEIILHDKAKLEDLFACYASQDPVVRMRVSNAIKRICRVNPEWVAAYLETLLKKISQIDQASTKWTLATLFLLLDSYMNDSQRAKAIKIMKSNLHFNDWIVQNTTAETLAYFSESNQSLRKWLIPELQKLTTSKYGSVARRAQTLLLKIS